jgi:flagellar biosynthesis protein FlhB
MAEGDDQEKSQEPTQKKLDDAVKKGDVAKSQEVAAFFVLFVVALIILVLGPSIMSAFARTLSNVFRHAHDIQFGQGGLIRLMMDLAVAVSLALALPFLAIMLAAVGGNLIQHRFVFSAEQLKPKMSKISPLAGFKRIFGMDAIALFIKGLVKISAVAAGVAFAMWPERDKLDLLVTADVALLLPITRDMLLKVFIAIVVVMAAMAVIDFLWQRHRWLQRQRMSFQELKEEFKQQEGSPEIKAKVRQLRRERARKRMMQEVPKAAVVITNPTHFAVALRYENGMAAPVVVAKGVDSMALKIREIAGAANVPIVENPPLARALHASVDLEDEIPAEHYKAVAEVIGFVMKMRRPGSYSAAS